MIVVFGYPFNKARANIRPSQLVCLSPLPAVGDVTREITVPVALCCRAVAAPIRYLGSGWRSAGRRGNASKSRALAGELLFEGGIYFQCL
jgi:hypothetical protein